jgi:uncharacterized membrane protein YkoI
MQSLAVRCFAVAAVFVASVAFADDKAEKVALDKAPKAIQIAIKGRFPGGDVTSLTKEKEGDKIVFDVELTWKGRKYEMDVHEDGTIAEVEKEKKLDEVPTSLAATVKSKHPDCKIQTIMEVNMVKGKTETPDHYEVTVKTAGNKEAEVLVTLDGKSVKEEKK